MKHKIYQAFTLIELVITITISAFVLTGLFYFLTETELNSSSIEQKTNIYVELSDFIESVSTLRMSYAKMHLFSSSGSYDFILLTNINNTKGVLLGVINNDFQDSNYLKLDPKTNQSIYGDKIIGIREVSSGDISAIIASSGLYGYLYSFEDATTFPELRPKKFALSSYNSGSIIHLDLTLFDGYYSQAKGMGFDMVPGNTLEYNLNF